MENREELELENNNSSNRSFCIEDELKIFVDFCNYHADYNIIYKKDDITLYKIFYTKLKSKGRLTRDYMRLFKKVIVAKIAETEVYFKAYLLCFLKDQYYDPYSDYAQSMNISKIYSMNPYFTSFSSNYFASKPIFITIDIEKDRIDKFKKYLYSLDVYQEASLEEIADLVEIPYEEFKWYYEYDTGFSPYNMIASVAKYNRKKKLAKLKYDKIDKNIGLEEIEKYFGGIVKYFEILDHTIDSRFNIIISAAPESSNKAFDFIKVEFPLYDEEWIKNNKEEIKKYAIINLKHHKSFTKYNIPITALKIYSIRRTREYINFYFCFKDELVKIEGEMNKEV